MAAFPTLLPTSPTRSSHPDAYFSVSKMRCLVAAIRMASSIHSRKSRNRRTAYGGSPAPNQISPSAGLRIKIE